MHPEDQEKIAFVTEWGVFIAEVMMFGLKTAPTTFHRIITEIFHDYISAFMQVFLDDFAVVWPSVGTYDPTTTLPGPMSPSSIELKPGEMRIPCHQQQPSGPHCQPRGYCDGPRQSEVYPECASTLERQSLEPIFGANPMA